MELKGWTHLDSVWAWGCGGEVESPKGLGTAGEAHGDPKGWVSRYPGGSFSPSPSFLLHPFPAR